jgi:FkbM family methyltransferase
MISKREICRSGLRAMFSFVGQRRASTLSVLIQEELSPVYPVQLADQTLQMYCPNELIRWRAETLLTKEPETIEWIDSFAPGDRLLDIGANVGVFTLYALSRGVATVAIEPESMNFQILNHNLYLNFPKGRGRAFCTAVSDKNAVTHLKLSEFKAGAAVHQVAGGANGHGDGFEQGTITTTLDFLVDGIGQDAFPTHIKIDVDGNEPAIIEGGHKTLSDRRLKSVLIELDETASESAGIVQKLKDMGFKLEWKRHGKEFDGGKYASIYNFLFRRN